MVCEREEECKHFDDEIMSVITHGLIENYLENKINDESSWARTPVLTNKNQGRVTINHVIDKYFFGKNQ